MHLIHLNFHALAVELSFIFKSFFSDKTFVEKQIFSVDFVLGFGKDFLLFCGLSCPKYWLSVLLNSNVIIFFVMFFCIDFSLCIFSQ